MQVELSTMRAVIDLITNDKTDFRKIVINLAKTNPELVIKMNDLINPVEDAIILYYRSEAQPNKITAIKMARELNNGMCLREAKEFVEDLVDKYKLVQVQR